MAAKPWTEAEKLGILFQIIEKHGTIPWDELTLPEGRTRKACAVMIDKEKQKVRKARVANGDGGEDGGTKRKAADGDDGTPTPTPKKAKTPRKKKETVKAGAAEEETAVKAEADDEDELADMDRKNAAKGQ